MSKTTELNKADNELIRLIDQLQNLEREYDKSIEHSANYLGSELLRGKYLEE